MTTDLDREKACQREIRAIVVADGDRGARVVEQLKAAGIEMPTPAEMARKTNRQRADAAEAALNAIRAARK